MRALHWHPHRLRDAIHIIALPAARLQSLGDMLAGLLPRRVASATHAAAAAAQFASTDASIVEARAVVTAVGASALSASQALALCNRRIDVVIGA